MIAALEDMRWLQAFATRLAQDEDAADDLVQDTMVAAWRQPPPDEQRGVRPWLASVLRNRLRMRARGDERRRRREALAPTAGEVARPDTEHARLEVLEILLHELRTLEALDQQIIVRRFFEGESAAEIGRALGIPSATIRSRLHRSLQRLRRALDRKYGGRSAWCGAVLGLGDVAEPTTIAKGSGMSITTKTIVLPAIVIVGTVGALALRPDDDDTAPARERTSTETSRAEAVSSLPPPAAPKARWQQRREQIRAALPPDPPSPAAAAPPVWPSRHVAPYGEIVEACLRDLDSKAAGAVTLSIREIGAPDIGTVYEEVEVVHSNFDDPEALECLVESMHTYVGDAPTEPMSRTFTTTMALGVDDEALAQHKKVVGYIVGAHIGEVRVCGGEEEGSVTYTLLVGPDGTLVESTPAETTLSPTVVDCITNATKRWKFPKIAAGIPFEHTFSVPVPGSPPRPR